MSRKKMLVIMILVLFALSAWSSRRVVKMRINTSITVMCPTDHLTVTNLDDDHWKLECWMITTQ